MYAKEARNNKGLIARVHLIAASQLGLVEEQ
jgi:hypothetical protein